MKLTIVPTYLYLFSLHIFVSANLDRELRKSIETVMKCRFREPPRGPVLAVTPSRFVQVVVILHERFITPACFRTSSKYPISVNDEKTWPFCIFGKCNQGRCQCAGNFVGPKCSIYSKKCWLMYCYLTSCHPEHQSLHCVCDPSLYGTKIITGIYWYDQGKSSKYVPPPPGWEDEPTGMIKLKGDSAIDMGRRNQNSPSSSVERNSARGSKTQNLGGRNSNRGKISSLQTGQKTASSNQNTGRKKVGFGSGTLGSKSRNGENADKNEDPDKKKTDVEEALEELEEVSPARKIRSSNVNLLLFIVLIMRWILRLHLI